MVCRLTRQVRRILSSSAAQEVRVGAGAEAAGDPDIIAAQQARLLALSVRTLASPYGRGALTLGAQHRPTACTAQLLLLAVLWRYLLLTM